MKTSERERLRQRQESDALQIRPTVCDAFFDPIEDLPSIEVLWGASHGKRLTVSLVPCSTLLD